jgi:hypothetical protein
MGAAMLGLFLRTFLPEHHLREDSRSVVSSLGVGISGAMAAFVLALLVQGAQISFVDQRNELIEMSANIEFLDKILNDYGPDANEVRAVLRHAVVTTIDNFWYADRSQPDKLERDPRRTKELYNSILPLRAQSDTQHSLKQEALSLSFDLVQSHQKLIMQQSKYAPMAFKVVMGLMVFWFASTFFSLGIYAPRNSTVVTVLMLSALSVTIAFLLIIELNWPFEGIIRMPSEPLTEALKSIGK